MRPPRFVQVIPGALEELVEEHDLDFVEAAVLARARDEANWRTGAIAGWTTTGYAAEWRLGYRLLRRAVDRLVELDLLECQATRGHAGALVVTVYQRLVRSAEVDNSPARSRDTATADDGRSRDTARGNRESARAQPRKRDSEQGEQPLDVVDGRPPSLSPDDALEAEARRRLEAKRQRGEHITSESGLLAHLRREVAAELDDKRRMSLAGAANFGRLRAGLVLGGTETERGFREELARQFTDHDDQRVALAAFRDAIGRAPTQGVA